MINLQQLSMKRGFVVTGLGIGQILSWGSTFYLLAVLAGPIADDTGWPASLVIAGVSVGLIIAGLGSPYVGALVASNHGRAVLTTCALLLALGLIVMGAAPNRWWYLCAWMILGLGMSGGLYSGVFAVIGHAYGASARSAITLLTLFGGFASTVCWPVSTILVSEVGWRWTALIYAAAHLLVTAPVYALTVPRRPRAQSPKVGARARRIAAPTDAPRWNVILLMAAVSTLGTSISALMSIHIFSLVAGVGITGTTAVVLASIVGPSQVAARLVEFIVGQRHHPLWTLLAATLSVAVAISFLGAGTGAPAVLLIVYGMGIGLNSIANGTVPLALFGQDHYARIMGRIALPSLIAQAGAPLLGSALIDNLGERTALLALGIVAFVAFALAGWLLLIHLGGRGRRS